MLSLYQTIVKNTVIDDSHMNEFLRDIKKIETTYNMKPIIEMSSSDQSALEYAYVNNYGKVLGPIYECYDRLISKDVVDISVDSVRDVLDKMHNDPHARSILLRLLNADSFYYIVPSLIYSKPNVVHYLSRYNYIKDLQPVGCCVLI